MENKSTLERIEARVDPDIRKLIMAAAELEGRSVSEFLAVSAKERAEQTLHRQTVYRMTAEDQARFAEALLDPPPPWTIRPKPFTYNMVSSRCKVVKLPIDCWTK